MPLVFLFVRKKLKRIASDIRQKLKKVLGFGYFMSSLIPTDDLRIERIDPLIPPVLLTQDIPLPDDAAALVAKVRAEIEAILTGEDSRLLVVVGPCSIHDPKAALEYGQRLLAEKERFEKDLLLVMRVYFEKPRTTVGWKGFINDPDLDDSGRINEGLRLGRQLLHDLAVAGIPAGTEFLDTITPQYIADSIVWGAIGARTTESQLHRQLASGLSMPIGFKNGTGGSTQIAVDAISAASHPHRFLGVTHQGLAAIVTSKGNESCHLILRGGASAPNFDAESIADAGQLLEKRNLSSKLMVDCSHANSGKDFRKQPEVAAALADQLAQGSNAISGVMLESHLVEGKQSVGDGSKLTYGQSITDACMGWEQTVSVLEELAQAVQKRRSL